MNNYEKKIPFVEQMKREIFFDRLIRLPKIIVSYGAEICIHFKCLQWTWAPRHIPQLWISTGNVIWMFLTPHYHLIKRWSEIITTSSTWIPRWCFYSTKNNFELPMLSSRNWFKSFSQILFGIFFKICLLVILI